MKKDDLVKLGIDEALAAKAAEAFAEELRGYIPKARFDEVNEAKKQLEKADVAGLQAQLAKLQEESKKAKEQYDAELKNLQLGSAVDKALLTAKAKNLKAVKALLELDKLQMDGDTVKGLEDQLKNLMTGADTKFLFAESQAMIKGFVPGETKDGTPSADKPATLAESLKAFYTPKA